MNSYQCSDGSRVNQNTIDSKTKKAKIKVIQKQLDEKGYNYCEAVNCGKSSGVILDCAHVVSVKKAKEMGKTELCYDPNNIVILCRECHQKYDKLDLKFTSIK